MLAIDVGNTRLKWGVWQQNALLDKGVLSYQADQLKTGLDKYFESLPRQESIYVCCVAGEQVRLLLQQWFEQRWGVKACFIESQSRFANVCNGYQNPQQMGADRWVAMVAAYMKYRRAICVIDCGTAITVDVVNAQGRHLGGLIMPGLDMMRNALYMGTQKIKPGVGSLCQLGTNTADAVYSGCYHLIVSGLQGLVKKNDAAIDDDLLCVVTGGNGELLIREFDCCYDEDLILYGLNFMANIKK